MMSLALLPDLSNELNSTSFSSLLCISEAEEFQNYCELEQSFSVAREIACFLGDYFLCAKLKRSQNNAHVS